MSHAAAGGTWAQQHLVVAIGISGLTFNSGASSGCRVELFDGENFEGDRREYKANEGGFRDGECKNIDDFNDRTDSFKISGNAGGIGTSKWYSGKFQWNHCAWADSVAHKYRKTCYSEGDCKVTFYEVRICVTCMYGSGMSTAGIRSQADNSTCMCVCVRVCVFGVQHCVEPANGWATLGPGEYPSNIEQHGIRKNGITGLAFHGGAGCEVVLYDSENFGGETRTYSATDDGQQDGVCRNIDWSDRAESFRIVGTANTAETQTKGECQITFWEQCGEPNPDGWATLEEGDYRLGKMQSLGIRQNGISGLTFRGHEDCAVTLYDGDGFGGESHTLLARDFKPGECKGVWSDRTDSFRIHKSTPKEYTGCQVTFWEVRARASPLNLLCFCRCLCVCRLCANAPLPGRCKGARSPTS